MYAWQTSFLVNGKPVIFVRTGATDNCSTADRWAQAKTRFYVSLKIFTAYRTCASRPDSWHQYTPMKRTDSQRGFQLLDQPEVLGPLRGDAATRTGDSSGVGAGGRVHGRVAGGLADRDDLQQLGRRDERRARSGMDAGGLRRADLRSADAPASTSTCCARTASPRRPGRTRGSPRRATSCASRRRRHEQLPPAPLRTSSSRAPTRRCCPGRPAVRARTLSSFQGFYEHDLGACKADLHRPSATTST